MFDRYIRARNHPRYETVLDDEVAELLTNSDLVVGNLEGPITTQESVVSYSEENPNHYRFTFDPAVVEMLKRAHFTAVSLGNNHILNFGENGLRETEAFLTNGSIGHFGNPYTNSTYIKEFNGITFGFIAESQFDEISEEETMAIISSLDSVVNHVIVVAHWGEEYEKSPNELQRNTAQQYIDRGADLVIGAHPHVIQTKEVYQEKWIYYSLGNFVFDQYFSEDVSCGALVTFEVTPHLITPTREAFIELVESGTTVKSDCASGIPVQEE